MPVMKLRGLLRAKSLCDLPGTDFAGATNFRMKPFVFLDLFDREGSPFTGPLHPHSGIATLTYVAEGAVSFIDPDNVRGTQLERWHAEQE